MKWIVFVTAAKFEKTNILRYLSKTANIIFVFNVFL